VVGYRAKAGGVGWLAPPPPSIPAINDSSLYSRSKAGWVFTVEFPHLLNLIRQVHLIPIYHEHFTYLSLPAVGSILDPSTVP